MEREKLLLVRNYLNASEGELLKTYLSDVITLYATKTHIEALEIKGMCRLLEVIKRIPEEVDKQKE